MAAEDSYIGSQVSLTSKIGIRYEGTLAEVDMATSKLKLLNVRSFGTEGRKTDGPQIPPLDNIYDAVIFNGNDIKALSFVSNNTSKQSPAIYNDPAIIQSQVQQQSSPVINAFYSAPPQQISNLPMYQPSLSLTGTASSSVQTPPQFTDLLLYQPSLSTTGTTPSSQNTPQIPNLPLYQQPSLSVTGTDASTQREQITNSAPQIPQIPNLPLYQPYLSSSTVTADSAPSTLERTQITNLPLNQQPYPYLSSYPSLTNPLLPPVHPFLNPTSTAATGTGTTITGTVFQQLQTSLTPKPNPNPRSSINAMPVQEDESKNKHYEMGALVQTGTSTETKSTSGPLLPNPSKSKPILPLPSRANPSQSYRKTGPVQYGRSASYNQHYNRGRGRGRGYNNQHGPTRGGMKYTEDFDFEAMNEKFNKDEVWGQLGRSMSHKDDNNNDDDYDNGDSNDESYDEAYYHSDDQSEAVKLAYKKDDFFDSLSGSQSGGIKFSEQIKLDTETFGHVPRYRMGVRGGGRGLRGGRGYYGRGGYNNDNNSNPNPNSETNPHRNRDHGHRGYYGRREE